MQIPTALFLEWGGLLLACSAGAQVGQAGAFFLPLGVLLKSAQGTWPPGAGR
jgi:hypothetical protein